MKSSVSDPRNKGTPKDQREGAGGIPWFSFLFFLLFSLSIGNSVAAVVMSRQLKSCGRERIILLDQRSIDWQNANKSPFLFFLSLSSSHLAPGTITVTENVWPRKETVVQACCLEHQEEGSTEPEGVKIMEST